MWRGRADLRRARFSRRKLWRALGLHFAREKGREPRGLHAQRDYFFAVEDHEAGGRAPGLSYVAPFDVADLHERFAPRFGKVRSKVRGIDQKIGRGIVALADPGNDMRAGVPLRMQEEMMRSRHVEGKVIVLSGASSDQDTDRARPHEGAKRGLFALPKIL